MDKKQFNQILRTGEMPDPKTLLIDNIVEDLWSTYVDEMNTLLARLENAALSLESGAKPDEDIAEIKRVLHSIKGDSGMCGVTDVHDICHETESILDDLNSDNSLADLLLKVKDWIESIIQYASGIDILDEKHKEAAQSRNKAKLKALVVDDDIVCRERLKMLLQDFFDCTFACNGKEGVLIYEKSLHDQDPFSLITLDINMPEMNGHEALETIRKVEDEHGKAGLDVVKVIMTTSESSSDHVITAFREGCEAYVIKKDMGTKLLDAIVQLGLLKVAKVQKDYVLD